MRSHPDTLELLLVQSDQKVDAFFPAQAPSVAVFLRVCEELEPELSWSDDTDRLLWLKLLEEVRYKLHQFRQFKLSETPPRLLKLDLERLAALAKKSWRGPVTRTKRELPFVADANVRRIAERDLASLGLARQQEQLKVAVVLAGCVVEAVLLDYLQQQGPADLEAAAIKAASAHQKLNPRVWGKQLNASKLQEWKLIQMIGVCGPHGFGVLTERTEQVANVLRDWRNFVHPAVESGEPPLQMRDAIMAEALTESVLEELARARAHP